MLFHVEYSGPDLTYITLVGMEAFYRLTLYFNPPPS